MNKPETKDDDSINAILIRFIELMDTTYQPEPWPAPKSSYNESYHGGDCEKHGRWYGICHSCQRESRQHYEWKREEFESKQRRDLRELADKARRFILQKPQPNRS